MNIPKILLSFTIIIIIAISSAVFTIIEMKELSDNTQKMYTHPFKVSNAVSDIQTSVITMHRNMKDIVLTKDALETIKIIELIQKEEENIYTNFNLIYKNYLGDKKDIDNVYSAVKDWKNIRQEVIKLMYEDKQEKAIIITKNESAKQVNNLYDRIAILEDYAVNKAEEFYNLSIKNHNVKYVISIFILTLIVSISIVFYITLNLLRIGKVNNKQIHLIDQNILMATFTLEKEVIFISNALCYVLDKQKEDLLHSINKYFFCDEKQFNYFKNKIHSGKEHTGEVYLKINDEKIWFKIEIFPELNQNYKLKSFNIFLTNINDKKRIEKVSITDSLTTLHNRNYFELIFGKEIRRSKRDEKPLSMIMFDIDFFKQYNDTYGHQEGDTALKAVARVLSRHTNRSYDYSFRLGGEEFVILSYDKDLEMLEKFTKIILEEVEALKISHKNSSVSNYLTISAGAVVFEETHLLSAEEMFKTVDKLLYEAKNGGRNCLKSKIIK